MIGLGPIILKKTVPFLVINTELVIDILFFHAKTGAGMFFNRRMDLWPKLVWVFDLPAPCGIRQRPLQVIA